MFSWIKSKSLSEEVIQELNGAEFPAVGRKQTTGML